jgi:hypothetical protein
MKRRLPLWLTLVPLLAAGLGYGWLWQGWARAFEAEVGALIGRPVTARGFPYRLEANLPAPRLALGEAVRITLEAASATLNRGPWRPELSVVRLEAPRASIEVGPFIGATLQARSGVASVNWGEGRLRRQSSVLQAVTLRLAGTPLALSADTLELHLREQQGAPLPATSPTREARGQLVASGTRSRISGSDPLTLSAEIIATGPERLASYDRWSPTGTLELTRLSLTDGHGEILSAAATLIPQRRERLRLAGTLETVCPETVAAAFEGRTAPPEQRLRVPLRLAFEGPLEAPLLAPLPSLAGRPRRAQMAACPTLRR